MFDFEKFPVYQKAEESYSLLIKHVLSNKSISSNIRDQIDRAAVSIILNIAEGAGKYSKKEKKNFYLTARASTQECVAGIRLLHIKRQIPSEAFDALYKNFEEISRMLSGLINYFLRSP